MLKVRIILFAVLLATFALLFGSMEYGSDFTAKEYMVTIYFLEGVVILTLSILCGATFFSFNENGQLSKNTYAWKYFAKFYTVHEKDESGEWTSRIEMPERLKLCPMFYMVALGLIVASGTCLIALTIGLLLYFILIMGISIHPNFTWMVLFTELLNVVTFLFVLFGIFSILLRLFFNLAEREKWKTLAMADTIIILAGLYTMSLAGPGQIQWESLNYLNLLHRAALAGLVMSAASAALITPLVLIALGCSQMKNTLPGQLILALYQNFCPTISVEK